LGALDHCTNVASCSRRFASERPLLDLSDPQQQLELIARCVRIISGPSVAIVNGTRG
jgi:hypothetical protein